MTIDRALLRKTLQETFGFSDFRPGQEEAVTTLLRSGRVVCIQPTGYGKSLLYQLPAVLLPGMTLVVSPLLALMRDQINHLHHRFNVPAGSINSDQADEENARVRRAAGAGALKILFIAPEQLDNLDTRQFLQNLTISLLVVDEAHCISTWGHDFRPAYRAIVKVAHHLAAHHPDLKLLGLTATADARVEADIAAQFAAPDGSPPTVLRSGMDRPNIALSRHAVRGTEEKLAWLAAFLHNRKDGGILYCATREQTEIAAAWLQHRGISATAYHAGIDPEKKRALQQAFIDGSTPLIAATNALGMGIDKPDIRLIVHLDTPGSITAYYQEVGRAGRDGRPAQGILLFDPADRKIQEHFIMSAQPTLEDFDKVSGQIVPDHEGIWPNLTTIRVRAGLHPTRVLVVLSELVEQGYLEKVKQAGKQVYRRTDRAGTPDLSRYARQNEVRRRELDAMMTYGSGEVSCLMAVLRRALGDTEAGACSHCSVCRDADDTPPYDAEVLREARAWLGRRDIPIPGSRIPVMSEGAALLDGTARDPMFVDLMRGRADASRQTLPQALVPLLAAKARELASAHGCTHLVVVPSQTWQQRGHAAKVSAEAVNIPHSDCLTWAKPPEQRQGQWTNNDQRKQNVHQHMTVQGNLPPSANILLLDDYTGSGATLKEAVRCLRKTAGIKGTIVPLTLARVRWRLGAPGFL